MNHKVDAVVVLYNPNLSVLSSLIDSLCKQVRFIFLVNNGSDFEISKHTNGKVHLVNLGCNRGIAYAQNVGIEESLKKGSDFVLISDQDTCYPAGYVRAMLTEEVVCDSKVAAVAPLFFDSVTGRECLGFYTSTRWAFKLVKPEVSLQEISQAISSGMLIKSSALALVGLMNEELFIDWVDFEWCWRARERGYKLIGNSDVIIRHNLGDGSVTVGFIEVTSRSPIRHYYITRNAFYLAIYCDVLSTQHKFGLFFRSFRYVIGYPVLFHPRLENLKAVTLGLAHGVFGRLGPKGGPIRE